MQYRIFWQSTQREQLTVNFALILRVCCEICSTQVHMYMHVHMAPLVHLIPEAALGSACDGLAATKHGGATVCGEEMLTQITQVAGEVLGSLIQLWRASWCFRVLYVKED